MTPSTGVAPGAPILRPAASPAWSSPGPRAAPSASDVLTMHRLGRRADGGSALVHWLTRRTGGWVGLVDRSGRVVVGDPARLDAASASAIAHGVAAMNERGLRAFDASDDATRRTLLLEVEAPDGTPPVLAVVDAGNVPHSLVASAATVIGTPWFAERVRRTQRRLDASDARNREAVLRMLMSGHVDDARRIASVLCPALPDPARVYVVECRADARDAVVDRSRRWAGSSAFVVPCLVNRRHVIVICPTAADVDERVDRELDVALAHDVIGCVVGASDVVPLTDTSTGYEQAFHALAVGRGLPHRWARFDTKLDPATILEPAGAAWAHGVLAPLRNHTRARATDPDADELLVTLRSWLSFSTAAARQLKIHRNTLRARVRRIEELLDLDLSRTDRQAALALAVRISRMSRAPRGGGPTCRADVTDLDDLIRLPALRQWATTTLRPVRQARNAATLEASLRTWLDHDARLSATAASLGISVPGARKRLQRLEQLLQRSLLHAPDARHELWLAVRAADVSQASRRSSSPDRSVRK